MKYLFFLIIFFVSILAFGQDSISITINGKALEFQKQEPIQNTKLEASIFTANQSFYKPVLTNEKGEFTILLKLPLQENNISLDVNGEKSGFSNHFIYTFKCGHGDTTVSVKMQLNREKICIDTWLPSTLYFDSNNCDSVQDSFNDLKNYIAFYKENKALLKGKKLQVIAYNSFSEKTKIAKCRAEKIKSVLLKNGLNENDFIVIVAGKNELTHYYYPDGCHTEKEFEEKIVLSKSSYKKSSDEQKKEMDILRRSVRFSWK